jgi:hypothetical protein
MKLKKGGNSFILDKLVCGIQCLEIVNQMPLIDISNRRYNIHLTRGQSVAAVRAPTDIKKPKALSLMMLWHC